MDPAIGWIGLLSGLGGVVTGVIVLWRNLTSPKPSNAKEAAKAAVEEDPLAGWLSERRAVRAKSHKEWLEMWYNTLSLTEKSRLWNSFEQEMDRAEIPLDRQDRLKQHWRVTCAELMVREILDPPVAKIAKTVEPEEADDVAGVLGDLEFHIDRQLRSLGRPGGALRTAQISATDITASPISASEIGTITASRKSWSVTVGKRMEAYRTEAEAVSRLKAAQSTRWEINDRMEKKVDAYDCDCQGCQLHWGDDARCGCGLNDAC